jgi:hypothetical protein
MLGLTTIAIDGNALGRVIENAITHRGVVLSTYVLCLLDPSPAQGFRLTSLFSLSTVSPRKAWKELRSALDFFWGRNLMLLVCATSMHVTFYTCRALEGTALEDVACHLHLLAQFTALFVFMYRRSIWKPQKGSSLIYQCVHGELAD